MLSYLRFALVPLVFLPHGGGQLARRRVDIGRHTVRILELFDL